jgi:hypothetical protein
MAQQSKLQQGNREKANAYNRAWRKANPDKERQSCKRYAQSHREEVTARVRRWQLANPARFKAQQQRSRAAQRDRSGGGQQILLPIEMQALPPLAPRETASPDVS